MTKPIKPESFGRRAADVSTAEALRIAASPKASRIAHDLRLFQRGASPKAADGTFESFRD